MADTKNKIDGNQLAESIQEGCWLVWMRYPNGKTTYPEELDPNLRHLVLNDPQEQDGWRKLRKVEENKLTPSALLIWDKDGIIAPADPPVVIPTPAPINDQNKFTTAVKALEQAVNEAIIAHIHTCDPLDEVGQNFMELEELFKRIVNAH